MAATQHWIEEIKDREGNVLKVGDAVSAQAENGFVVEGNVYGLQPYGCEWLDPAWTRGTVIITDHLDGQRSHWNPDHVDKI